MDIQICKALHDALAPHAEQGRSWDEMMEMLLFEVPDEAMAEFMAMADPHLVQVSDHVGDLLTQIATAFGMTPLGLTVLMSRIKDKAFEVETKFEAYASRSSG